MSTTKGWAVIAVAFGLVCPFHPGFAGPSPDEADSSASAQPWTLMEAIEGATYERRVYDESNALVERQRLQIGTLVRDPKDPGVAVMPVTITTYDHNGATAGTSRVEWRCDEEAGAMLMTAAIYAGPARNLKISLDTSGAPVAYPRKVVGTRRLGDIRAIVKVRSGVLRVLGTRTKLALTNRTAQALNEGRASDGTAEYVIRSKIMARILVLAIPIKRVRIESKEWISSRIGLVRQRLTFANGRVSEITRVQPTAQTDKLARGAPARQGR